VYETHRLPEAELVYIGDDVTINRDALLQIHFFHNRLMRLDVVESRPGAALGPFSISLLGTVTGAGTIIGPSSLVMRGEKVPPGTRWLRDPIRPWTHES
jgi:hypothetical protein